VVLGRRGKFPLALLRKASGEFPLRPIAVILGANPLEWRRRRRGPSRLQTFGLHASWVGLSHLLTVSPEQLVDRSPARVHLLGGRRGGGADRPAAHESSLLGRGPIAGQRVPQSRVTPPARKRSRHRIDRIAYATPDPRTGRFSGGLPKECRWKSSLPHRPTPTGLDFEFLALDFDFKTQPA
jgi:hypothetical protein